MVNKQSNKWILFPRPNPAAALRLFCFHYAGGSAQVFHGWPDRLPPSVEMGAIQLPGRGHRLGEPHVKRLVPLCHIAAQELLPYLDKPFVFFGHSLGALLCFETARILRREKRRQPAHLFVSATEAPHRRTREEPLSGLPKSALVKKLREFNGTPMEVLQNDELLDLMLPTIRADFELSETYEYHPESPLECPMTIYGGLGDHEVEAERLAAWSEMTVGACEFRMFPGDHFYIHSSRSIFLRTFAGDLLRLRLQN
ncbi:MAG: thioesterase domain-containing protein [Acidobacteria bacterium]|nr:thioesterase domain-containing protein [Acidobacteriota bacterium]